MCRRGGDVGLVCLGFGARRWKQRLREGSLTRGGADH